MISSIVLLILQYTGTINPSVDLSFWKTYIPVCLIEMVVYFKLLTKWGEK